MTSGRDSYTYIVNQPLGLLCFLPQWRSVSHLGIPVLPRRLTNLMATPAVSCEFHSPVCVCVCVCGGRVGTLSFSSACFLVAVRTVARTQFTGRMLRLRLLRAAGPAFPLTLFNEIL